MKQLNKPKGRVCSPDQRREPCSGTSLPRLPPALLLLPSPLWALKQCPDRGWGATQGPGATNSSSLEQFQNVGAACFVLPAGTSRVTTTGQWDVAPAVPPQPCHHPHPHLEVREQPEVSPLGHPWRWRLCALFPPPPFPLSVRAHGAGSISALPAWKYRPKLCPGLFPLCRKHRAFSSAALWDLIPEAWERPPCPFGPSWACLGTRGCQGAMPVPSGDGEVLMLRGVQGGGVSAQLCVPGCSWRCWSERTDGKPGVSPGPGFSPWLEGSVQRPRTRPRINTARAGRAAAQPRRLVPRAQKVKYVYLLPSPGGSVTPQLWGSAWGKGSAGRELKGSSVVSHGSLNTRMGSSSQALL